MTTTPPIPASIVGSKPGNGLRNNRLRKARAMYMLEATMKGKTQAEIGEALGATDRTVRRELDRAIRNGWAEELRERMKATLQDVPDVHREILTTPAESLHKLSRGYKLKLDAANALHNGLGIFKQESHKVTETFSLSAIASEGEPAPEGAVDKYGFPARPRIAFQPETIDGDVVEEPE